MIEEFIVKLFYSLRIMFSRNRFSPPLESYVSKGEYFLVERQGMLCVFPQPILGVKGRWIRRLELFELSEEGEKEIISFIPWEDKDIVEIHGLFNENNILVARFTQKSGYTQWPPCDANPLGWHKKEEKSLKEFQRDINLLTKF